MAEQKITPASSVSVLKGVGKARVEQLNRLGIRSLADLVRHVPFRYEQQAGDVSCSELRELDGQVAAVTGTLERTRWVGGGWGGAWARSQRTF